MKPRTSVRELCIDSLLIGIGAGAAITGIELGTGNHAHLREVLEHPELYSSMANASILYLGMTATYLNFRDPQA